MAEENVTPVADVTVEAVFAKRSQVRLIDVREDHEFVGELGHIEGAELVPLATVEERSTDWDRTAPLVIVCRSGKRSTTATRSLGQRGFLHVENMAGGMIAWNDARLPVQR